MCGCEGRESEGGTRRGGTKPGRYHGDEFAEGVGWTAFSSFEGSVWYSRGTH